MNVPGFLIIGAMKAGTTSLYRDLLLNPAIFMPVNKEPSNLIRDETLEPAGRSAYAQLFANARRSQLCGEASTTYTKLPRYPGVPERAKQVCGENLRVVYSVREPVARIISHHYHSFSSDVFGPSIDEEIHRQPELLDYTRYAMQVQPWIDTFGREQVLLVRFEDFVANRKGTIEMISRFLGVEPRTEEIDEHAVYNRSEGKPLRLPIWRRIRKSPFYRRYFMPYLPLALRDKMRELVFPKAPARPDPPSDETKEYIYAQLEDDLERLRLLFGRNDPVWSVSDILHRKTQHGSSSG